MGMLKKSDLVVLIVGCGFTLIAGAAMIIWPTESFAWLGMAVGWALIGGAIMSLFGGYVYKGMGAVTGVLVAAAIWFFVPHEIIPSSGPHFEFQGVRVDPDDGRLVIKILNTNETYADGYNLVAKIFLSRLPNDSQNKDIEKEMGELEDLAKSSLIGQNTRQRITRGFGLDIKASSSPAASVIQGYLDDGWGVYVGIVVIYSNSPEPIRRVWVTETCAQIIKPFTGLAACHAYNRYFYADRALKALN